MQARLRPYRDNILTLLEQIPTWSIQWIPRWVPAPIRGGGLLTTHCDMPAEGAWSYTRSGMLLHPSNRCRRASAALGVNKMMHIVDRGAIELACSCGVQLSK